MSDLHNRTSRKVVVVGAGAVGATFAYALIREGMADEIVLNDINRELAEGQILDLAHGLPYVPSVRLRAGDSKDYADATVIVITAGAGQKPGESRLDLLSKNAGIVRGIMDEIVGSGSKAVVVVVTNPVDVLTRIAIEHSGWRDGRVFGSGTVLDSARFRYLISECSGVNVSNVHAYILGEHGDSEIAAWSISNISGVAVGDFCPQCGNCCDWEKQQQQILQQVRDSAYHIIDYKGATYFAVGLALVRIVGAVLRNDRSVLTVSSPLHGQYGLENVCLSVPCVLTSNGVSSIVDAPLEEDERKGLHNSAEILKKQYRDLARIQEA
ncbi:MAG: L-lactate dehydrogenase [Verrucomicrobiota bacterium]